jgi:phytoene desaturase
MKKIAVIGAGFAGLASAACLAKEGYEVTVFEKNDSAGGRARKFESGGFVFDMGPSWYWMPDVFERFFKHFGKSASDYYQLKRLDPSYRIFYGVDDAIDVPAGSESLYALFEELEPGSSQHLKQFLLEGEYKYAIGMERLVYKPGLSVRELMDYRLVKGLFQLHVFQSLSSYVKKFFVNPRILKLLEFPVLFLGATASNTPALYSLMNYADMVLGTWYPMGGMYRVVDAMVQLATEHGVNFRFNHPIDTIEVNGGRAAGLRSNGKFFPVDYVVAGADYHHVESDLLAVPYRRYSPQYWDSRTMAPSSLIFYVGLNKRVKNLLHHNLFFDEDFDVHSKEIYEDPKWPTAPLFYVSCTSKTDPAVAPAGHENLFILIPVAPALKDEEAIREFYFDRIMDRLEKLTGEDLRSQVIFKRSYAHRDFIRDYNAFKGNAYGLANTLLQTANFKPSMINKKVRNLFYTGQLTVPGPGVPPAIISGQVVSRVLLDQDRKRKNR